MKLHTLASAVILGQMIGGALASQGTAVFGLPIGGKLPPLKVCPVSALGSGENTKVMCWVGKPFVAKDGSKLGSVVLPNPDGRPAWAAYASFQLDLSKDGTLERLVLNDLEGKQKQTIANSISQRFGLPVETTLHQDILPTASWRSQGIGIHQSCHRDRCSVQFLSATALNEIAQRQEAAKRVEAARPATP